MMFIKYMLTHLHLKWRVHSILPLAPRAKQPALHIHTRETRESAVVNPCSSGIYKNHYL